ncbi:MAG TPA: DUF4124 domain-containing protein [Gallionella sp.]|nr:DUF4124 domain-containing protein [Gallionella sp.]
MLIILLMLASTSALAAINKWVDDHGVVHYSDQPPPPGQQPKTLHEDADTQDSASGTSATQTVAEKEAALKKQNAEKQSASFKEAQKQAAEDALKANCSNAQDNLRTLQSGIRIMEVGANGERSYLDDTQRQQRIDKAQQDIAKYCK